MVEAALAISLPPTQLPYEDGEPLESWWHRLEMNLLIDLIDRVMAERSRHDYFANGNMFIHYSVEQVRAVSTEPVDTTRHFRGPDVFFVAGTDIRRERKAWVVWEEGGRYPDLIIELLSPSTAVVDRTVKKAIYERTFRTPDYVMYDRETRRLEGFRLVDGAYRPVPLDAEGRLWVPSLGLRLGHWDGVHARLDAEWIRLYDHDGRLIPTPEEIADAERRRADAGQQRADAEQQRADTEQQRADAEQQRADAEQQRADAAERELARLRAESSRRDGAP